MNLFTIIVLLIIAVFALTGYMKGFVRTFTSMTFFILSAVLVYYATPYVSDFLENHTPLYSMVEEKCEEMLATGKNEEALTAQNEEALTAQNEETPTADNGNSEDSVSSSLENSVIEALPFPDAVKNQLKANNTAESYQKLAADTFKQYLAAYLASLILKILTYVITLLLVLLILRLTIMTLDIITKLPVFHGINQALGLIVGAGQGLAFVWIAFLIITVFSQTEFCGNLMSMINKSPILEYIYNSNLFLTYLFKMI